jgi:hypothetical protein
MGELVAGVGKSVLASAQRAAEQAVQAARAALGGRPPRLAIVTATVDYDLTELWSSLRALLPGVAIQGITTALGVLDGEGVCSGPQGAVGVLLLAASPAFQLGVGHAAVEQDARAAGATAARRLVEALGGARPEVLIFHGSPGNEEDLLLGVADVLPGVPAYGGSAADHAIAGEWRVLAGDEPLPSGVALAGIAGPLRHGGALVVPYEPTAHEGLASESVGRNLRRLDDRPAGETLDGWLGGDLAFQLAEGGNILGQTALRPLGQRRETTRGEVHYVTIHPAMIRGEDRSVDVFARIEQGSRLCLMQGTEEGLANALDPLITTALARSGLRADEVRAALLIYCAGCSAAVGPRLAEGLKKHVAGRLPGVPVLGMCTFGEQGFVPDLGNIHQDLSLSLLLLGEAG